MPSSETAASSVQQCCTCSSLSCCILGYCIPISFCNYASLTPMKHQSYSENQSLRATMEDFSSRPWIAKYWGDFFSTQPTAREIIDVLSLPAVASRGMPKFTESELQELHREVQKLIISHAAIQSRQPAAVCCLTHLWANRRSSQTAVYPCFLNVGLSCRLCATSS